MLKSLVVSKSICAMNAVSDAETPAVSFIYFTFTFGYIELTVKTFTGIKFERCLCDIHWLAFMV